MGKSSDKLPTFDQDGEYQGRKTTLDFSSEVGDWIISRFKYSSDICYYQTALLLGASPEAAEEFGKTTEEFGKTIDKTLFKLIITTFGVNTALKWFGLIP